MIYVYTLDLSDISFTHAYKSSIMKCENNLMNLFKYNSTCLFGHLPTKYLHRVDKEFLTMHSCTNFYLGCSFTL